MTEPNTQIPVISDEMRRRRYFPPSKLNDAFAYVSNIIATIESRNAALGEGKKENLPFIYNFATEDIKIPDGFGLLVSPQLKRVKADQRKTDDEDKQVLVGYVVAQLPDMELLAKSEKGAEFLQNATVSELSRKLKSSVIAHLKGDLASLPSTVEAFLERKSIGEGLEAFNKTCGPIIKVLHDQKFATMHKEQLKNVFMSADYAKDQYPNIPQARWVAIMHIMKEEAAKKSPPLPGTIFDTWIASRDTKVFEEAKDIDLSAFGVGDDADEAGEATAA